MSVRVFVRSKSSLLGIGLYKNKEFYWFLVRTSYLPTPSIQMECTTHTNISLLRDLLFSVHF